jgi:hypothetical protein
VRSHFRVLFVALFASALMAISASGAQAVGIEQFVGVNCGATHETCAEEFSGEKDVFGANLNETHEPNLEKSIEQGYSQAAGHVPWGVTDFTVAHTGSFKTKSAIPNAIVTHVRVDVAPGLATSPANVPQCTMKEFGETEVPFPGFHFYAAPTCKAGGLGPHETGPTSTVIGEESATVFAGAAGDIVVSGVLYNLEQPKPPARARSALFGAALKLPIGISKAVLEAHGIKGKPAEEQYYVHTLVEGNVEWGQEAKGTGAGDYHDYFEVNVSPALPLVRSRQLNYGRSGNGAFITNGTSCPGNHTTRLTLESVPLGDEEEVAKSVESGVREVSSRSYETLVPLQKCKEVPFSPTFSLASGASGSDEPDQITTELSLPHFPENEIDSSQLKTASITLPEGLTLNPSAAHGLEACTPAQARIHSETFGVACPAGSELGTVALEVPTLPAGSLTGNIYLGGPETGAITDPPYTIYVVANSTRYDVSVRLKGEVIPNPVTGQLTTVFNENPEQPFSKLTLHFNRGALTSVANPLICGSPSGTSTLSPVATEGVPAVNASFGVAITGCAASIPFALTQGVEYENVTAGAHTAYALNIKRADGQQYLEKVKTSLPLGVVGEIPTVTQCAEAQANAGTCTAASKIGTATVQSGSGSAPFTNTGNVYLTGAYHGAPYGLSIVVPATAGPFELGNVVTRSTINIDQKTARVTAETTLPTIVKGIPLRLRSLNVNINRQGFALNPTNCAVQAEGTSSTLTSMFGAVQTPLNTPFQVEGCSSLGFKPTFKASSSAKYSKANGASLVTNITMPAGGSNIKLVKVTLPKQLPSRGSTLKKACLEAVFKANPFSCPKESNVGTATVVTPTLPGKMTGPAYLVSRGGAAFPNLELVLEDQGVRVILEGNTDIKNGITTTTFAASPDVPVTSVNVNLPLGPHSALAPFGNLCAPSLVIPTAMTGQNGKTFKQNTKLTVEGCGVQIVGHKVVGNTAFLTIKTFAPGRISGSGKGVKTVARNLSKATNTASLKVPLASGKHKPFSAKIRVGFLPKKKGKHSTASITVKFR